MKKFSLYLQFVLLLVVCTLLIMFLFVSKKYFNILELFLGIGLITMAYNTEKYYHNKKRSIAYLIFGVFLLVMDLLMIIGD